MWVLSLSVCVCMCISVYKYKFVFCLILSIKLSYIVVYFMYIFFLYTNMNTPNFEILVICLYLFIFIYIFLFCSSALFLSLFRKRKKKNKLYLFNNIFSEPLFILVICRNLFVFLLLLFFCYKDLVCKKKTTGKERDRREERKKTHRILGQTNQQLDGRRHQHHHIATMLTCRDKDWICYHNVYTRCFSRSFLSFWLNVLFVIMIFEVRTQFTQFATKIRKNGKTNRIFYFFFPASKNDCLCAHIKLSFNKWIIWSCVL